MKSKEKREALRHVGDLSQIYGIKDYTFNGGKSKGMRALDVKNGMGIEFTVLPDRCLDIPYFSYKGTNISFISKTGLVAPEFFVENDVIGFLRSFNGGFLATCGLTYAGAPCFEEGRQLGLHGTIGNTPAKNVCACVKNYGDEEKIEISGEVIQASVFDENLKLTRTIICDTEKNTIRIKNKIENNGFIKEPLMSLFHINFGFPFLSEDTRIYLGTDIVNPREEEVSKNSIDSYHKFGKPIIDCEEQVFFHSCSSQSDECFAMVHNERLEFAVLIKYNPQQCPWLTEWKCMKAGDYALGLEPANCHVMGRNASRSDGSLKFIEPGECKDFDFDVIILDNKSDINNYIKQSKESKLK